jgi:hypothetical protein
MCQRILHRFVVAVAVAVAVKNGMGIQAGRVSPFFVICVLWLRFGQPIEKSY